MPGDFMVEGMAGFTAGGIEGFTVVTVDGMAAFMAVGIVGSAITACMVGLAIVASMAEGSATACMVGLATTVTHPTIHTRHTATQPTPTHPTALAMPMMRTAVA